jgi:hypothetical protein
MRKRERANLQVRRLVDYIPCDILTAGLTSRISFKAADMYDILKVGIINRLIHCIQDYDSKKASNEAKRNT